MQKKNNNNGQGRGASASADAFGGLAGVVLLGPEAFQREILTLLEPFELPVLGRFDLASAVAAPSLPVATGEKQVVLLTTGKALQGLLRQRRRKLFPRVRIIVVAPLEELPSLLYHLDREELLESLAGCIEPDQLSDHGLEVLRLAAQGLSVMPAATVRLLLDQQRGGARLAQLDDQERELLALIMTGASNAEIAASMKLPLGRVRNRVRGLLTKLGCRSRTAAAILAHRYFQQEEGQGQAEQGALGIGPPGKESE